ncbi:MAG: hypothetical protein OEW21_11475 [Betaproteobacteria bacterium]|nr:hypothetical protein [Betaproteobacteria bacterium]
MIAASATLFTAFLNLRLTWRKEMKDRARGQPITPKNRRGPILTVVVMMLASAVAGFAFSQYLIAQGEHDARSQQAEVHAKLAEISAATRRLEQARTEERGKADAAAQRAETVRAGEEGVAAVASVAACNARHTASAKGTVACTERDAVQIGVCAAVPLAAQVKDVALYTRFEDSQQLWSESSVAPGEDAGQARFQDKYYEQPDSATSKQVCFRFANWDSGRGRLARIVVKYGL